ncbi:hypothetical protein L6452_19871 [Arctium lappa]|uniref:Uncharacterized protein n=1 Tax=Arctium lappa TaxID=4217 RepID=A0ACB9B9U9_ARCLA|nr:hypothetical protein L6452_19871 [Arctium lappa]
MIHSMTMNQLDCYDFLGDEATRRGQWEEGGRLRKEAKFAFPWRNIGVQTTQAYLDSSKTADLAGVSPSQSQQLLEFLNLSRTKDRLQVNNGTSSEELVSVKHYQSTEANSEDNGDIPVEGSGKGVKQVEEDDEPVVVECGSVEPTNDGSGHAN